MNDKIALSIWIRFFMLTQYSRLWLFGTIPYSNSDSPCTTWCRAPSNCARNGTKSLFKKFFFSAKRIGECFGRVPLSPPKPACRQAGRDEWLFEPETFPNPFSMLTPLAKKRTAPVLDDSRNRRPADKALFVFTTVYLDALHKTALLATGINISIHRRTTQFNGLA